MRPPFRPPSSQLLQQTYSFASAPSARASRATRSRRFIQGVPGVIAVNVKSLNPGSPPVLPETSAAAATPSPPTTTGSARHRSRRCRVRHSGSPARICPYIPGRHAGTRCRCRPRFSSSIPTPLTSAWGSCHEPRPLRASARGLPHSRCAAGAIPDTADRSRARRPERSADADDAANLPISRPNSIS